MIQKTAIVYRLPILMMRGCPTQRTVLVHDGVFANMLLDTSSATRLHLESTGNGFKSSYASDVSVQPMNCCIQPGKKSLETMCQEMGDGLVIDDLQGLHAGLDFVTTNFSLQCNGYLIKNGRKRKSHSFNYGCGQFPTLDESSCGSRK